MTIKTFEGNEPLKFADKMRGNFVGRDEIVWRASDVYQTAVQAIPIGGASTAIIFQAARADTGGLWNGSFPARLTVPVAGWYSITGFVELAADAAANVQREITVAISGAAIEGGNNYYTVAGANTKMNYARVVYLNANDFVQLVVRQFGAAAINTVVGAFRPSMSMCRFP